MYQLAYMQTVAFLLTCLLSGTGLQASTAQQPRGTLLELHSCELYAGGCIVSSEATQGGRYMLRAWNFTGGQFCGIDLSGLKVALLQTSGANLAAEPSAAGQSVVYLPKGASEAQRTALVGWLKSSLANETGSMQVRIVPIAMSSQDGKFQFSAGEFASLTAASLESCPTGSCGEALWYRPRTQNSVFTVGVNQASKVREPLLQLKWEDAGKKSLFLARFGERPSTSNLYVSLADLCGPAGRLF